MRTEFSYFVLADELERVLGDFFYHVIVVQGIVRNYVLMELHAVQTCDVESDT